MENIKLGDWVLYKNNQLIAFNKPAGLAVQPDKSGDPSLLQLAQSFCKHPLHLIHRIDRPASGVVLFAKTDRALRDLNDQFKERALEKTYLAVVQNKMESLSGNLTHYISKNQGSNKSIAYGEDAEKRKEATLHYKHKGSIDRYHLLEIDLHSGRHHQIRAQLSAVNNPIKGDVKYGFRRKNKDRSIHLHAWKLKFQHPVSKEMVSLSAPIPDEVVWNAFNIAE